MAEKPVKPELNEIATLEKDIDLFAGYLKAIPNPDRVLALEAGGDLHVYDSIGRDPHVASVLRTRTLAVIGKEWDIIPATEKRQDVKIAEFVKQIFLSFPFDATRRALLRGGTLKGYGIAEIMWDLSEGGLGIKAMVPRAQRRFRFGWDGKPRLLSMANLVDGDEVPDRKFQTVTFGDEPETPYGVGLAREIYWPWWFKKNGIKFWAVFLDKFGQPTPWGKYPGGTPAAEQDKLLAALGAMQTDNAIITPDTMDVSLLEAARAGGADTYEKFVKFMNDEISIAVIGQTATVSGTPGKLGNDQTQENVRFDLMEADADALCEAFNAQDSVIRWLVDYNFPGVSQYPQMWIRTEKEKDLKTLAERDQIIAGLVPVPAKYFYDTYGIEQPAPGEDVAKAPAKAAGPGAPAEGQAFAEPEPIAAKRAANADNQQAIADAAQAAAGQYRELLGARVEGLLALLEETGDLVTFRERLADVLAGAPPAKVVEALTNTSVAANLAGRLAAQR